MLALVYIVLGTALDGISMIVLTMGVMLPMVQKAGFDLIWFGIFIVLLVEIAEVTPPVGFNLFVLQNMTGRTASLDRARRRLPFFLLMVAVHLLIWYRVPELVTWLPRADDGRRQVTVQRDLRAKLRTPFAMLGIDERRRRDHARRAICRSASARRRRATSCASARSRELERYLDDPEFRFTRAARAAAARRSSSACGTRSPRSRVGESRTYGEIARMVRSAPRAVGQACGANRIALIMPCHRVVGAQGSLGGFMNAAERRSASRSSAGCCTHEGYRFGA